MNITFILGNGFDLNLNLQTDYKSFYNFYIGLPNKGKYSASIAKLKEGLNSYITQASKSATDIESIDWSDLEIGLGQYVKEISSEEEYEAVYYDIRNSLGRYLKIQEDRLISMPPVDIHSFYLNLTDLEIFLLPVDVPILQNLKERRGPNKYYIRILTFNYTKTFEHILGSNKSYVLPGDIKAFVSEVRHIHRQIDQLILGVNDISQINNSALLNNDFVKETLIKPSHCSTYGDNHSSQCLEYINQADLVVLYGVSIGDTDRKWWEAIANRIRTDRLCSIIIFWYGHNAENYDTDGPRRTREERKVREKLMTKMRLSRDEKSVLEHRIFVHLIRNDKRIFDFPRLPDSYDSLVVDLEI